MSQAMKTWKQHSPGVVAEVSAVLEKHGMKLQSHKSGVWESGRVELKLTFDVPGSDSSGDDFKKYAAVYGLKPEWLGAEFKTPQGTWKVTGLNPSRRSERVVKIDRAGGGDPRIMRAQDLKFWMEMKEAGR